MVDVCPDNRRVTLRGSYASRIPERPQAVRAAADLLAGRRFERIHGVAPGGHRPTQRGPGRSVEGFPRFENGEVPGA
ncbi:hypothetical protein [Streptomyces venezuelae]|uniref:hypothetical protein n=1 Tax=Streptomyces venezuelae TaxID=54571 RepID=UPI0037D0BA48